MNPNALPRLYRDLAAWWPLLSAPADYAEEAAFFLKLLGEATQPPPRSLLELGSGGGNNAWHFKAHFQMTLSDLSTDMLAISQALNPECEHLQGDMRTLRLGRQFDAVFLHDAIMYMTTLEDLRAALTTAFVHCRHGGVALFAPDCVAETFIPGTDHGGEDGDGRRMRYLEWTHPREERDNAYIVDFAYVLQEGNGPVRVVHEQHHWGLFPRETWLTLLSEIGFQPRTVIDPFDRELFVAHKAAIV